MNLNFASGIRTMKSVITANSPVLLVGTAIAGVVATGVLAAKGGYKARGIVALKEQELDRETTTQEKAQLTWLCYAAPALTGASTIASVVGVHSIHTKRHAALAGLYAVTTSKLDDYREKAEELLGPKKTQELNNSVAQKNVDRAGFSDAEVLMITDGTELCYDEWSGRYFMGSMNKIEAAVNDMNKQLIHNGEASVNDYYEFLGLTGVQSGMDFGWPGGTKLEPRYGNVTSPDGRPAIAVWFQEDPRPHLGIR